jgi:hypothetical protein
MISRLQVKDLAKGKRIQLSVSSIKNKYLSSDPSSSTTLIDIVTHVASDNFVLS